MSELSGRMIVKKISHDARIWEQLSDKAREIFPYVLPWQDTRGRVARDARGLRLTCVPLADINDDDMESIIQEWLKTKPRLCWVENGFIVFSDFETCNGNLDFIRKRKQRMSETVQDK